MGATAIIASVLGGVQFGESVFKMDMASKEASAREKALRLRMEQIESSTNARKIQQMEQLNKTMATQNAMAGALGEGVKGPVSYNMIQLSDFNKFDRDINADDLTEVFQKEAVQSEIVNTEAAKRSAMIGGGFEAASGIANSIMGAYALSKAPVGSTPYSQTNTYNLGQSNSSAKQLQWYEGQFMPYLGEDKYG